MRSVTAAACRLAWARARSPSSTSPGDPVAETINTQLRKLATTLREGIILHINSPGGSGGIAGDLYEVMRVRKEITRRSSRRSSRLSLGRVLHCVACDRSMPTMRPWWLDRVIMEWTIWRTAALGQTEECDDSAGELKSAGDPSRD